MMPKAQIVAGVFCCLAITAMTSAQDRAKPAATPAAADFSKEPVVIEMMRSYVRFERDGTGSRELTMRVRVQSEAVIRQFGLLRLAYASSFETLSLEYVRVKKPNGQTVETPVGDAQDLDSDVSREAPMYTDQREKHLAVKALSIGDVMEYRATWKVHDAAAPGHFWIDGGFFQDEISLDEEMTFDVPRDPAVQLFAGDYQASIKETDNRKVFTLHHENLEHHQEDPEAVWKKGPGGAKPAAIQLTSFSSWAGVGQWFDELESPQQSVTAPIRAKAEEITRGKSTAAEKIQALYEFVALNYRYIGISLGLARYTPHRAEEVLANRYGDCKDKHTLFAALLAAEGIKAYPALISSSQKIDDKIPTPSDFDHLITAIPHGNGFEFLDTTAEVGNFGYLVGTLRGKSALVVMPGGGSRLVTTLPDPPGANTESFLINAALDEKGVLEGTARLESHGDSEFVARSVFRRVSERRWDELVQRISKGLGFAGTVSNPSESRPEAIDEPWWITYDYRREDYETAERYIVLPLPPILLQAISERRRSLPEPITLGSPFDVIYQAKVRIPEGTTAVLPKNVNLKNEFATYNAQYGLNRGTISASRQLQILQREIPGSQRTAYAAFVKAVFEDESSAVKLLGSNEVRGQTSGIPFAPRMPGHSQNAAAQKLYDEGFRSLQLGAPFEAVAELEKAVKLEPTFFEGWWLLASARMMANQKEQGIEAFCKAIALNPGDVQPLRMLGMAQITAGHNKEAITTWRQVLGLDYGDAQATGQLTYLLMRERMYQEAIDLLSERERRGELEVDWQRELGRAYLQSGDTAKAMENFQKALERDRSPGALNSVAFAMAEAKFNLTDALQYAQEAVKATEEASAKSDDVNGELRRLTRALAAEWDTLGWVKFQMGDYEGAANYLESAWAAMQAPAIGEHVGLLYEKTGKKQQALTYAITLSEIGQGGDAELKSRVTVRMAALKKSGAKLEEHPGLLLSSLRKYQLGLPAGWTGFGAGTMMITLSSVVGERTKVSFAGGSEGLRDYASKVAKIKFRFSFPDERPARIVETGMLGCSVLTKVCTLILAPLDQGNESSRNPSAPTPSY